MAEAPRPVGIITGKKSIEKICGRSWDTILRWINELEFPACKMDGVWQSHCELINEWVKEKVADCGRIRGDDAK
jgi:predicted DNA-binding transcriptional regulator AlpA